MQQYAAQNDGTSQEIPNNVNESDNDPRSSSVVLGGNGYKYHKKVFDQLQYSFCQPKLEPIICTIFMTFRGIQSRIKKGMMNLKHGCWL